MYIPCRSFGLNRKSSYPNFFFCAQCDNYDNWRSLNPTKPFTFRSKTYVCIAKHVPNDENIPTHLAKTSLASKQRTTSMPSLSVAPIPAPTPTPIQLPVIAPTPTPISTPVIFDDCTSSAPSRKRAKSSSEPACSTATLNDRILLLQHQLHLSDNDNQSLRSTISDLTFKLSSLKSSNQNIITVHESTMTSLSKDFKALERQCKLKDKIILELTKEKSNLQNKANTATNELKIMKRKQISLTSSSIIQKTISKITAKSQNTTFKSKVKTVKRKNKLDHHQKRLNALIGDNLTFSQKLECFTKSLYPKFDFMKRALLLCKALWDVSEEGTYVFKDSILI